MMSPREAIDRGQVWLRPFGHFAPDEQGYMGFPSEVIRDRFLDDIEDGALVVVWIRQQDGHPDWTGRFCGILRLERRPVLAIDHSDAAGERQRRANDSEYLHAVPVVQAWEADPSRRAMMKGIIPSLWPNFTRTIGTKSKKMPSSEISNILPRMIREVSVFGCLPVAPGPFKKAEALFK
ncbi:MAG: hypothetical protein CML55_08925 [Rhodobacteraceae bacterium]|nr:hypothetical protein [Paracoccaceae bacterium]MBO27188.1 hypothetical protein [Paracoccaceae bacterium]|tara:strand:+ start:1090 stop:1626 length:537 start_codon:yes stop_codon:yes gene_type:complete